MVIIRRLAASCVLGLFTVACEPVSHSQENDDVIEVFGSTRLDVQVDETSGLAAWGGFFWTINDSGNSPQVFKLDSDGKLLSTMTI
ncbi:MAG: hypothetical protein OXD01_15605, partial [Gammaproteobacteria bacterium]|nr:hypothetical protein [Gammaproteobacteria bacterium]